MLDRNEVRDAAFSIAREIFDLDPEELSEQRDLVEDFNASSVLRLDYLVALEKHFGVRFDPIMFDGPASRLDALIDAVIAELGQR